MSQDKEREAFERRMLDFGWRNFTGDVQGEPPCWYYANADLNARWIGWREARAALASQQAVKGEPNRPDILERLSYHVLERDDLTLDECLDYLAKGWAKVHGRTERQMVMQILALLAGQTASPPSREPQWQPIETAPKDGTLLLLWCKTPPDRKYASPDTNFCIGSYDDNGGAFANNDDWYSIESHEDIWGMGSEMTGPLTETARVKCEPTHWMPLPPPPGIHSREGGSK